MPIDILFHIASTLISLGVKNERVMSVYKSKVTATLTPSSADIANRLMRISEPTESDIDWIHNLHYLDSIRDSTNGLSTQENII